MVKGTVKRYCEPLTSLVSAVQLIYYYWAQSFSIDIVEILLRPTTKLRLASIFKWKTILFLANLSICNCK